MVGPFTHAPRYSTEPGYPWRFWKSWIIANAMAELIGLGSSSLLWLLFFFGMESYLGVFLAAVVVVIGSTLLEGSAVGIAQALVLRQWLPKLSLRQWWLATMLGAFVAWCFGMAPSTMMTMNAETTTAAPPPAISDTIIYLLALLMGLVLGPVLALPQWWVLRRHVARAWLWLPANAVAWSLGMLAIFVVIGLLPAATITVTTVLIILMGLLIAGAIVGAVHGVVLIWLLTQHPAVRPTVTQ